MTYDVYPGGAVPPDPSLGRTWWIDPVNGSASGDGSAARPWRSVAAIAHALDGQGPLLATVPGAHKVGNAWVSNADGPVKPGDTILLKSGQHGALTIGATGAPVVNSEFVFVKAAPGETPVLSLLATTAASKFVFDGLTFEELRVAGDYLSRVSFGGDDLILANCALRSIADASAWTRDDWMTKASYGGVRSSAGVGHSYLNNTIENIVIGAALANSSKILFRNNIIRNFGWDGMDIGPVQDVVIDGNQIYDHINVNDCPTGWHSDAMQFIGVSDHVTISANWVMQQTRDDLPCPGKAAGLVPYLQGIGMYGGTGPNTRIAVANNLIALVSSYTGVAITCAVEGSVTGNTVLSSGDPTIPASLYVKGAGCVCSGNTAPLLALQEPGIVAHHNIALKHISALDASGVVRHYTAPGQVVGDHNIVLR